jgi:ComF family protein
MRLWGSASALVQQLDRLLLPGECMLCQAPMPARVWDDLVCPLCEYRWVPVTPPWCERCGQPGLIDVACRFCAAWPGALVRVRSARWLEGSARAAVHHLKYDGWPGMARSMARAMRRLEPLLPGVVLVPIPLGERRRRTRGYNQAERLAAALGLECGLPVSELLRRRRDTRSQTALTPEARAANVAGAFVAAPGVEGTLVLVDDVCTTGATLAEAAVALVEAGAARVEAVTFARASLPVELTV